MLAFAATFASTNSYGSVIYFVVVVVLGMYVVLSMFIVILLDRFSGQDESKFEMEDLTDKVHCFPRRSALVAAS